MNQQRQKFNKAMERLENDLETLTNTMYATLQRQIISYVIRQIVLKSNHLISVMLPDTWHCHHDEEGNQENTKEWIRSLVQEQPFTDV